MPREAEVIVVFTDREFPRILGGKYDGAPDFIAAEKFISESTDRSRKRASVILIADNYPGSRDDELIAHSYDRGWSVKYIGTTRSSGRDNYAQVAHWALRSYEKRPHVALHEPGQYIPGNGMEEING